MTPDQSLTEAQLRQLYDEEEAERVIAFFSAYVREVRLSTADPAVDTLHTTTGTGTPTFPPTPSLDHFSAEYIAHTYLLPHLPPAASVTPAFTLKRLSLTSQRIYLALFPPYYVFFSGLARLALWEDYPRSLRYCIIFWFLWFHDLLLPALAFRIVFGLLRRRLSTFPTLKELQERRQESARALKFGETVQQRLSVTTLGPVEIWRLFKLHKSEEKAVLSVETDEEESLKRDMLHALNEVADFHERVRNVFAWRRPHVSYRYLLLLIVIGFGTLILPAQYVAKVIYWFWGMLFWHATPLIAALPRIDRARVLLLFRDAPTDADYAMELIAKRVASGQDVGVASARNRPHSASNASASTDSLASTLYSTSHEVHSSKSEGISINWKKWGERVAHGKQLVEERGLFLSTQASRDHVSGGTATISRSGTGGTHTFLAQYVSSPGLITLTSSTLSFTSLTGTHARLVVPLERLRGVRRSGLMKGISIAWIPEDSVDSEEKEEKFHWVGDRDELFARLVGSEGARWMRM